MSKKMKSIIIWGVVAISIGGLSINKWITSEEKSKSNRAAGSFNDSRITVKGRVITYETLTNKVLATGTVIANEEVDMKSEISGRVVQILFKEGGRVSKGELLIKLNDSELQAQLEKSESRKKLAESNEVRQRILLEKELLAKEVYDATVNELNSVQADIALLRAQIAKTEIRAPFDGVIGLKYVSEGSYISTTTKIATLQNILAVKIDFSIPEKYVNDILREAEITFTISGTEKKYKGRIFAIEPKIDPATRTVAMRAICTNTDGKIFPGAFANIEVVLKETKNALMVPTESIIPELKSQKVFVYKNGLAQSISVETGLRTDTKIQITKGLQPGDTVITTGVLLLRTGSPVAISDLE
ncbi:efflux RND transporter periplasmic adaptor subunit [bacterium]|nr:MAG: efflux RND transporter periplasmic adaptor subunit [bacterium]